MFKSNKPMEIRRELMKALGKTVSPCYYYLSLNYAKRLLSSESKSVQCNSIERPVKTLAIV